MKIDLNLSGLDAILKDFKKSSIPKIQIGVLGSKDAREGGSSNATIGAVHEFGAPARGMPQRSFLRMPLTEHLDDYLKRSRLFTEEALKEVIEKKTIIPWLKKIAIVGEEVIADAFDSGGFGQWAQWKNGYRSSTGNILVDTQQLRESITSRVAK